MQDGVCRRAEGSIRNRPGVAPIFRDHVSESAPFLSCLSSLGAGTLNGRADVAPSRWWNLVRLVEPPAINSELVNPISCHLFIEIDGLRRRIIRNAGRAAGRKLTRRRSH